MLFPSLKRDAHGSAFGQQLAAGFPALRFVVALEKDFREYYLNFNIRRVRVAACIALVMLLSVIGLDMVGGGDAAPDSINPLRLGIMLPVLVFGLLAMLHPDLRRYHQWLIGAVSLVFGAVLSYGAVTAGIAGATHIFASLVLFVLYVYLFVGLLFHTALLISTLVAVGYVVMGGLLGLPGPLLFYQSTLLCAACAAGGIGAYTVEHALRTSYLESRLLYELAQRDGLTGLYNRRLFDDQVTRIWRQARRDRCPVQVILIDIDYFKVYNDLYGHQAGDDCLRRVATTLNAAAQRPFDLCARYGGEEFVLVLYDPPRDYAEALPERLRREVAALGVPHEGSPVANVVTVSIGVALATPDHQRSFAGIVQMADEALYQAKEDGRNRVVFRESYAAVTTGSFRVGKRAESDAA